MVNASPVVPIRNTERQELAVDKVRRVLNLVESTIRAIPLPFGDEDGRLRQQPCQVRVDGRRPYPVSKLAREDQQRPVL